MRLVRKVGGRGSFRLGLVNMSVHVISRIGIGCFDMRVHGVGSEWS